MNTTLIIHILGYILVVLGFALEIKVIETDSPVSLDEKEEKKLFLTILGFFLVIVGSLLTLIEKLPF